MHFVIESIEILHFLILFFYLGLSSLCLSPPSLPFLHKKSAGAQKRRKSVEFEGKLTKDDLFVSAFDSTPPPATSVFLSLNSQLLMLAADLVCSPSLRTEQWTKN